MAPVPRAALSCAVIQLTRRDLALLDALTRRVKLLPLDLVGRLWWARARSSREMQRRLSLLESAGLLSRRTLIARSPVMPERPLVTWKPGELIPDFADVVWRARRAAASPVTAVRVVVATRTAASLAGGAAQPVRPGEVSHDLRLAAVFAVKSLADPSGAVAWQGESILGSSWRRTGGLLPDAVLALPGRRVVVEVVGTSYSPASVRELHHWCGQNAMGYELW